MTVYKNLKPNRIMYSSEKAYKKAYKILKLVQKELPNTSYLDCKKLLTLLQKANK